MYRNAEVGEQEIASMHINDHAYPSSRSSLVIQPSQITIVHHRVGTVEIEDV